MMNFRSFAALYVGMACCGLNAADDDSRVPNSPALAQTSPVRARPDDPPAAPGAVREGWRWQATIPESRHLGRKLPESRVKLRVEQGWLIVRRATTDDDLEWEVVLARASDPARPEITIDTDVFELRYRGYVVRENRFGSLRIYRERKLPDAPPWPALTVEGRAESIIHPGTIPVIADDWRFIQSGPTPERPDIRLRLQPQFWVRGHVALSQVRQSGGTIGSYHSRGAPTVLGWRNTVAGFEMLVDDGDILFADRVVFGSAALGMDAARIARRLETTDAPSLEGSTWLNVPEPLTLEKLRDRTVVVSFFRSDLPLSVRQLAELRALHARVADRGVTVIGVHDGGTAEQVAALLKEHGVTFPVLIDQPLNDRWYSGRTAARYGVEMRPMHFLIDPPGKIAWGMGMAPPVDEVERRLFHDVPAPALAEGAWLNTPRPLTLEGFRNKVVLLAFIDIPPGKSIDALTARVAAVGHPDLVVLGVYRPFYEKEAEAFLQRNGITFPVLVDSGETFDRYHLELVSATRYFLIDRKGKLVGGLRGLPTEEDVRELLKSQ